ncbi:hypothetical protein [Listeria booriae]|uniref:hypothetical protein n=1 Tax=Listeria booriae TaxID=1552123 RepID=UPI001628F15F|nr:hypothetical protein [Listeria booriae]MBC1292241.1 hypothetical protein [Listeria booriae]MBC1502418.1 hypothetical protein [Listeria booriae]
MTDSGYLTRTIMVFIYSTMTIIFLIKLNQLNKILLDRGDSENSLDLLSYNHGQPWKYFGIAGLLVIIGGLVIYFLFCYLMTGLEGNIFQALTIILFIILLIVLVVLLIKFIQIPILKAVFSVLCIGAIGLGMIYNR